MRTLNVLFMKIIVIIFNWLGKLKSNYKFDTLIIGNYDYITVCQKAIIKRLHTENISNHFLYDAENKPYFAKLLAYSKCAFLIGKARNILLFDYCFPVFCIKKQPEQKIYQLWHANGSFKRFGLPNFMEKYGEKLATRLNKLVPIHSNYDYIFVSNEKCIKHYMSAFNDFNHEKYFVANNTFLDMLIDSNRKKAYAKNGNEINVIIAKTYNYNPEENIYEQLYDSIRMESEKRGIKVNIIPLLHPKIAEKYDKINVMMKSDVLVTDYSSVCFEASAINKKVAFLRGKENCDVFVDAAKKIYYSPKELAIDIMEDKLIDNQLNEYLTFSSETQMDKVIKLIKNNRGTRSD